MPSSCYRVHSTPLFRARAVLAADYGNGGRLRCTTLADLGAPAGPAAMQVHETCRDGCSRRWLLLPLFLLAAWYLTPFTLQGAATDTQSCSKRDPALCDDNGEERQGRDHVVCVYADRVVKTVWAYVETRLA